MSGTPDPQEYADKQSLLHSLARGGLRLPWNVKQLEALKQLEDQGELDLDYMDEAGFCLIPYIPYGWQPVGETVGIDSQRSRRLNVLGLMSRSNHLQA